jgi:hypothetical protein
LHSLAKNYFMKLKIILLAAFFAGATYTAWSQTSDAEAEAVINLLGVQKREAVSKLVPVTGKDSVAFWKIYDEYEQENKKVAKTRLGLYEKTAQSYANLTPDVADSLSAQYFSNRMGQEKSLEEYYKKIKAATNSVVAFEFYQAEVYLLTQIRAQIMQQIPTYGQLVAASKKK